MHKKESPSHVKYASHTQSIRSKHCGFTLVELLVVIGIIALLVGILLPALSKARKAAQEVKCLNNLRQLCLGVFMYADSQKGSLPYEGGDGTIASPVTAGLPQGASWDEAGLWFNAAPTNLNQPTYSEQQTNYLLKGVPLAHQGANSVFVCPAADDPQTTAADKNAGVAPKSDGYLWLWGGAPGSGVPQARPTYMCYVLNSKLNATHKTQKMSQLRPGAAVVIFMEKRMIPGELLSGDKNYAKALGQVRGEHKRFTARHRNGGFIGFADGHVAWFSNQQVNTPSDPVKNDYNYPDRVVWDPFGPEN